jgi:hypothetical protein
LKQGGYSYPKKRLSFKRTHKIIITILVLLALIYPRFERQTEARVVSGDIIKGAKKYDIPYSHLLKQIKEAGIPIPPSGYWIKLNFGKNVTKLELSEPADEMITIYKTVPFSRKKKNHTTLESISDKTDAEPAAVEFSQKLENLVLSTEKKNSSVLLQENGALYLCS